MRRTEFYSKHLCKLCRKVWKDFDGADWNSESGRKYISMKKGNRSPDLKDIVERGALEEWDITMLSQLIRDLQGKSVGKAIEHKIM